MFDGPLQRRLNSAVARQEAVERLAVRQVEAAASGEQKLAPERWHGVIDGNRDASARQHFGGHQSGRSATDDGGGSSYVCPGGMLGRHREPDVAVAGALRKP